MVPLFLLFGCRDEARNFSVVFPAIGFVLYAFAMRKANLSVAYPLMVAISILVVLGFTALHEHVLRPTQAVGALVILVGIWLVTRSA
ncbi:hypothetical protein [Burkholderia stagnalis]|uniref:hypothetical protein n=1 Tax=Burkholderia stagnalis TaxID=1503054 RepID=UPI000AF9777E|nr:hypothetical protein [Burkholderia stagnalis]